MHGQPREPGRFLKRLRRFCWQRDQFATFLLEHGVPSTEWKYADGIVWIGVNTLALPNDPPLPLALTPTGQGMSARGDSGLLAYANDQLAGWVWVRPGAFTERAGCGFLKIPHDVRVVREFKIHPDLRGRGIGRRILGELGRRLLRNPVQTTIAFVSPTNVPSLRSFEEAGFARIADVETRRVAGVRLTRPLRLQTNGRGTPQ